MAGKSKVILIIEDEDIISGMHKAMLEDEDFELHFAESADEAHQILHKLGDPPDLIVADGHLKDGDSLNFIIHVHTKLPEVPIIACSSDDGPNGLRQKQLEAGAAYEVEQKYEVYELIKKILTP